MTTSYQIRIRSHIDLEWAEHFSGLEIRHQADGTSYLTGTLADQSELQGVARSHPQPGPSTFVGREDRVGKDFIWVKISSGWQNV